MGLAELIASPGCEGGATAVRGIELDSRKVQPGDVFLAMPGELHDGRQFIEQAVANGASAVIAEPPVAGFVDAVPVPLVELPELQQESGYLAARFFGEPSSALHMVGVTGTNGKTTTSRLVAQLMRALGKPCGVIGTLGASLEDGVAQGGNTTPDAVSLQRQLAAWVDEQVLAVCMEVSSHALVQGRVNGVAFETAVFTNLSRDHLDYHGSMEAYGRAKLALFDTDGLRQVLVNADDPFSARILDVIGPDVQAYRYSLQDASADVVIEQTGFANGRVHGRMRTPWGEGDFASPLVGHFNLSNLAAAVAAVVLAGEELEHVLAAVADLQPVPGRMQAIENSLGFQVVVDYAHTPDALEQALVALRPYVSGQLITVFGCGGDRDPGKRQVMGRIACARSDRVVVTSDNPRGEDPAAILADIETGCSGKYMLEVDRKKAIDAAVGLARPGDCVVIAGKGHEDYQIINGEKLYFSDEAEARSALQMRASV
ncbi:hypothetical protein A3709_14520 [Halioglobus sp. HI00S01]|uniref:UDP-N-acetylmuramoyl-L-alanyl-D-glutamate--2, 6-diaminopimelate ligase n=1 Tax=Halioglobus sp. HI00S01 TaxID=1822214 RepID=UPI0007C25752|nr:UDP-N-acetylmuramoyl-L-alanyl-D-glutamate--2,6-diaminopimelate ligase [Halioglobus sp. HI00S01]KZX59502.1 hypothetical protein A3709_14520 [Halioglobus sp. HI00S01]